MNRIHDLLDGHRAPGVYAWDGMLGTGTIVTAVGQHGWRCVVLHGDRAVSEPSFLEECARAGAFPAHLARSWAGLAAGLADLSWMPALGYVWLWERADVLATLDPGALDAATQVFGDAAAQWRDRGVPFSAVLRGDLSGLPTL